MDTRSGVCGWPAPRDSKQSLIEREGTWNTVDRERDVVDGQAANDWSGNPVRALRQGIRRQSNLDTSAQTEQLLAPGP
jgi:hypothetical protein